MLLSSLSFAGGYDSRFERISIEQGLSQASINCMLQDSYGYMWFGTQDGLNKYDGYAFTVYKHDPTRSNTLSDNNILSVYEDASGILWLGTEAGGLNRFDRRTGKIESFTNDTKDPNSLPHNSVLSICGGRNGELFIGTNDGFSVFDRRTNKFENYSRNSSRHYLNVTYVYKIFQDEDGILWLGTSSGLLRFDPLRKSFTRFDNTFKTGNYYLTVASICQDKEGYLWIGTFSNGLYRYDRKTDTFRNYKNNPSDPESISSNSIETLYIDRSGSLWIGTFSQGLSRFDTKTGRAVHFRHNAADLNSLSDSDVLCMMQDRSGILWVGTFGGLNKFELRKELFQLVTSDPAGKKGLPDPNVYSLCEDNEGNIWSGSYQGGISKYDRKTGQIKSYNYDPKRKNGISSRTVWSIYCDKQGILWLATDYGLNRFDQKRNSFKHYLHRTEDSTSLVSNAVMTVMGDVSGRYIWVGTENGIDRFDPENEKFLHYRNNSNTAKKRIGVISMYQEKNGTLWYGTWGSGLVRLNPLTGERKVYRHNKLDYTSVSHNVIMSICPDPLGRDNILWVGTSGGGLNMLDKTTGRFTRYVERDGLANNLIYGLVAGNNGELWISTNKGISRLDIKNSSFKNYDVFDGLQSNEFNQFAYGKTRRGELLFGGLNGYNIFDPSKLQTDTYLPPIVITSFKKFNKEVTFSTPIDEIKTIELSYKDYVFSFEFAALNYSSPHKNRFAYKMEGFDQDWIEAGTQRNATYTNLDPGEYIFRVKGSNSDGLWNHRDRSIRIIIHPPFWQTAWFRLSVMMAISLTAVYIYKRRIRNVERQKRELERLVKERTIELQKEIYQRRKTEEALRESECELKELNSNKDKFFSLVAHDLKSPFSSILGFSNILTSEFDDMSREEIKESVVTISSSISKLYNMIENLLQWSRIQIKRIDFNPVKFDISQVAANVIEYLEVSAYNKNIFISNTIGPGQLVFADRNMIGSVLQNLIANAIKFSREGGTITVSSQSAGEFIEVSISDTGVGISDEDIEKLFRIEVNYSTPGTHNEKGSGLGLILCKELIEQNGGSIRVNSKKSVGTTFTFSLPQASNITKNLETIHE